MIEAAAGLAPTSGARAACATLGVARATFYRRPRAAQRSAPMNRLRPPLAFSEPERRAVLDVLHCERFVDAAPRQIYATLLDEQRYLCSVRPMYRMLEAEHELWERRNQCRCPVYTKPELLATAPNQVWSWDISKLKGPTKWNYFYLYVTLDIFSRYVVGWMVAPRESATLAELGVTKTHSRHYISTHNPYSEAHFKTLKYRPEFPERFGSIEDSRALCRRFFDWYNHEHRHSGLAQHFSALKE